MIDILLYQDGRFHGLDICLESIRVHSPDSRIIVIGKNVSGMDIISEEPYLETFNKFLPFYEHHSTNPPEFELRCIKRWFVYLEYIKRTDIKTFISLESDIITFCNWNNFANELKQEEFNSPHASFAFISHRHGLEMFCKAILWIYTHKESKAWQQMIKDFNTQVKPSISDMNLVDWFSAYRKHTDLRDWHKRSHIVDPNICLSNGLLTQNDRKRIFFYDGFPYVISETRVPIKMDTLHCWGPYKTQMKEIWQMSRESVGKYEPVFWK